MSQTQTNEIQSVVLKCGIDECDFESPVTLPDEVVTEDLELLNSILEPDFVPTPEQEKALQLMIHGSRVCPVHDKQKLGFVATYKITATATFEISADGDVKETD